MALGKTIVETDSYGQYLAEIGQKSSYRLEKTFICGLPAAWLYMKALGLEEEFFSLLAKVESRSYLMKELLYLLQLTNQNNEFFPKVPDDILRLEIPDDVLSAQLELAMPDFKMAFSFNRHQAKEVFQGLTTANRMIRIGTKKNSLGVMYRDNKYCVYHADNTQALEFKTLDGCLEVIARTLNNLPESNDQSEPLVIISYTLANVPAEKNVIDIDCFKQFCKTANQDQLLAILYTSVQAGFIHQIEHLRTLNLDFNHVYSGAIDLLLLAVSQPKPNLKVIKFLAQAGVRTDRAVTKFAEIPATKRTESDRAIIAALGAQSPLLPSIKPRNKPQGPGTLQR